MDEKQNVIPEDRAALAQLYDSRLREAWNGRNKASMIMGWFGAKLKHNNLFQELGFTDYTEYFQSRGFKRSTFFKMVALAEKFSDLPEEDFLAMLVENAWTLSRVQSPLRNTLVKAAAEQSITEFEDTVANFNADLAGVPRRDYQRPFTLHLSKSQRTAVMSGLQQWMRDQEINDPGYALEMLVAEYTGRLTLIGYYRDQIHRLEEMAAVCGDKNLREKIRSLAHETRRTLDLVVGERHGTTTILEAMVA